MIAHVVKFSAFFTLLNKFLLLLFVWTVKLIVIMVHFFNLGIFFLNASSLLTNSFFVFGDLIFKVFLLSFKKFLFSVKLNMIFSKLINLVLFLLIFFFFLHHLSVKRMDLFAKSSLSEFKIIKLLFLRFNLLFEVLLSFDELMNSVVLTKREAWSLFNDFMKFCNFVFQSLNDLSGFLFFIFSRFN